MKTILFINKDEESIWSSYLNQDFLLDEYLNGEDLAVCFWNGRALCAAEAVGDLPALVGDAPLWQALIVTDLRDKGIAASEDVHFDNPFDFPENYGACPQVDTGESVRPLIRLTQMLGGVPERTKLAWPSVEDVLLSKNQEGDPRDRDDLRTINTVSVEYGRSDDHYSVMERYRIGVAKPVRILCVTPRDVDPDLYRVRNLELDTAAQAATADEVSGAAAVTAKAGEASGPVVDPRNFWERNGYPASARFVICDRKALVAQTPEPQTDPWGNPLRPAEDGVGARRLERDSWFRFWMSVLTLAITDLDPSILRPYKVHRISVEVEDHEVSREFSRAYSRWVAAREAIAERKDRERGLLSTSEYDMKDLSCCDVNIPLRFDQVDEDDLYADQNQIRLIKDRPEDDLHGWREQLRRIRQEFVTVLRAPRRAMRNAVRAFQSAKPLDRQFLDYCVLNEYQRDVLSEDLQAQEIELAATTGARPFASNVYDPLFDRGDKEVKQAIGRRPTFKDVGIALALSIGALLLGFVPYILAPDGSWTVSGNAGVSSDGTAAFANAQATYTSSGWSVSLPGLGVFILCALVMAAAVYVLLRIMRGEVRQTLTDFNGAMNRVITHLHGEASRVAKRISGYGTFRKRFSVLERQQSAWDSDMNEWLDRQDALLRTRMGDVETMPVEVHVDQAVAFEVKAYSWERIEELLKDPSFYSLGIAELSRCPLASHAAIQEDLTVPYRFISEVSLQTTRIH